MRHPAPAVFLLLAFASGCTAFRAPYRPAEDLAWSRKVGVPREPIEWTQVRMLNFDTPGLPRDSAVMEGEWEVRDGRLWAVGGSKNRTLLLGPAVAPPVRIEFDCTNWEDPETGTLGDITVHLNTESGLDCFARGYTLTTGSYYNNCTTFYREGRALAKTEYSPVRSGVRHRVQVEIADGHIRYWLDGQILLEVWDPEPLQEWEGRSFGLRTWNTRMAVDHIRIDQGRQTPAP